MKKSLFSLEGCNFQRNLSLQVKIPCLSWGRITLIQLNNPINDCAPFLFPRPSLYSEKNKRKKNKMGSIQPRPTNWQCGMKIKRWDQFKGKKRPIQSILDLKHSISNKFGISFLLFFFLGFLFFVLCVCPCVCVLQRKLRDRNVLSFLRLYLTKMSCRKCSRWPNLNIIWVSMPLDSPRFGAPSEGKLFSCVYLQSLTLCCRLQVSAYEINVQGWDGQRNFFWKDLEGSGGRGLHFKNCYC